MLRVLCLWLLASCQMISAAVDVVKEAAVPAVTGAVVAATGVGPIVVGASILAADITTQAIEGREIQNEINDVIKERVVEKMIDPTGAVIWRLWKWAIILIFLASWWFPTPRALWMWAIKLWRERRSKLHPPDP